VGEYRNRWTDSFRLVILLPQPCLRWELSGGRVSLGNFWGKFGGCGEEDFSRGSVPDLVKTETDGQTAFDWLYYYLSHVRGGNCLAGEFLGENV